MNAFLLIFNSANSELLWRRTRQVLLGRTIWRVRPNGIKVKPSVIHKSLLMMPCLFGWGYYIYINFVIKSFFSFPCYTGFYMYLHSIHYVFIHTDAQPFCGSVAELHPGHRGLLFLEGNGHSIPIGRITS